VRAVPSSEACPGHEPLPLLRETAAIRAAVPSQSFPPTPNHPGMGYDAPMAEKVGRGERIFVAASYPLGAAALGPRLAEASRAA
jgi:hypothetical protein